MGPKEFPQLRFSLPAGSTQFVLVRHGESAAYIPGTPVELVDGHGNPPLSELGVWQADRVGDRLQVEEIAAIYTSNLVRTQQTAAPLAGHLGVQPIVERELREVFLGEWDGGIYREKAAEGHPDFRRMQVEERWDAIPGAESNESLTARTVKAIESLHHTHPDQMVAVVVHAGVIGAILAHAAQSRPFAFMGADNGSIHHLVVTPDRWLVRRFNDTGHLESMSAVPTPPV